MTLFLREITSRIVTPRFPRPNLITLIRLRHVSPLNQLPRMRVQRRRTYQSPILKHRQSIIMIHYSRYTPLYRVNRQRINKMTILEVHRRPEHKHFRSNHLRRNIRHRATPTNIRFQPNNGTISISRLLNLKRNLRFTPNPGTGQPRASLRNRTPVTGHRNF